MTKKHLVEKMANRLGVSLRAAEMAVDALIGTLSPDLLVLTGDILMRGWKDAAVDLFLKSLPKAHSDD